MKRRKWKILGADVPVIEVDTVVVGSGCAGLNAADSLHGLGKTDVAVVTEGVNMGTSRNTGSDKQTYYKLSLAGGGEDSVRGMARDLFRGEGVQGPVALAEAAGSARAFMKLLLLGVPFPANGYGEFVGYKTDHDPRERATSAGPLTSKYMTECLEKSVRGRGIPILDGLTAMYLLVQDNKIEGLFCLDEKLLDTPCHGLTIIKSPHVILATGGPAACYSQSVYPESQTGQTGMALEAGAWGANLHQWQYGLASVKFRWNVSGTYQQALPRYISVDSQGVGREFLLDAYETPAEALNMVFLKGYQWPFDVKKLSGSSRIDVLVHREMSELGRRVYMDFRQNPTGLEAGFAGIGPEARIYLERSGALFGTPAERLAHMNPLALKLYKDQGIDLYKEPLEVAVCAQHHNGGLWVDAHWRTNITGLYAAGEVAGTFGAYRPGGSALNATQVGSFRAAEHIAYEGRRDVCDAKAFSALARPKAEGLLEEMREVLEGAGMSNVAELRRDAQHLMTQWAAHIRYPGRMRLLMEEQLSHLAAFFEEVRVSGAQELPALYKLRDLYVTQAMVLSAMTEAAAWHGSHGGGWIADSQEKIRGVWTQLITRWEDGLCGCEELPVEPLPVTNDWFETVWQAYRDRTGG